MNTRALLLLTVLSACNSPGPHFRDLPATRVTIDGSVFDVRVRGELAEALRVNGEYAPRLGPIYGRAAHAMSVVSGCRVAEVRGDQAQTTGILECGSGTPRAVAVPQGTGELGCIRVDRGVFDTQTSVYEDYECDPI